MKARAIVPGNPGHHAVQFYNDADRLCISVADFLADGLAAHQPTIVIASPDHRRRIAEELDKRKFKVKQLQRAGSLLVLDAQDTLDQFMVDGQPDPPKFKQIIGDAIEQVIACSGEHVVRAYGEMVDVLWRGGNCEAAIKVESLWNQLAQSHAFSLMCGYAMGSFLKHTSKDEVCAQHTHVHQIV